MGIQPAAGKNGQAPMLQVKTSSLTHPGQKRPNNEDYISSFKPDHPETLRASGRFFIVTDGVGGAAAGERASRYAAEKIKYEYYNLQDEQSSVGQRLTRSMQQANLDIYRYSRSGDRFLRMATTAVAAVIRGDELTVANVGDSRAYLIRDGQAQQITWDHTAAGEMIKSGIMTEEEAAQSRAQNRLTRSIGGAEKVTVDIFEGIRLLAGDKLLLCSDGLSRYASKEQLVALSAQGSPDETTRRMVDYANQNGGIDNISVILVNIEHGQPAPIPIIPISRTPEVGSSAGELPPPVDADLLDTWPSSRMQAERKKAQRPRQAQPKKNKRSTLQRIVPWLAVGIILVFFLSLAATLLVSRIDINRSLAGSETSATSCVKQANPDDTLEILLDAPYIPGESYYYFSDCQQTEQAVCSQRNELPPPEYALQPGWWVEIPGITSAEACEQLHGLWAQWQPEQ